MKTRQAVLAGMLLLINVGCREGGDAHEKANTKPSSQGAGVKPVAAVPAQGTAAPAKEVLPIPVMDSTTASIQFKREGDTYSFSVQPKDTLAVMAARCAEWTLDSLPGAKVITSDEESNIDCNDGLYELKNLTAAIRWVDKDSSAVAKSYGSEYVQVLSSAANSVLLLAGLPFQGVGSALLFMEMPLGETVATLTFHSDDACENQSEVNSICEKRTLPPPTVGNLHLQIKINVQEDGFEIREWP